jgi:hypothetical protein
MMPVHEHFKPCPRRPLGSHRTAASRATFKAAGWPPSDPGLCRPRRHRLRPADRMPVATVTQRAGVWQRHHLLAAFARLAEGRVWQRLHETLLNWLGDEVALDWTRASADSLSIRSKRGASRRDRTRSTAASAAPSTTSSLTAAASRWPCGSRPPTRTAPPSSSRLSMRFHPSSGHGESRGDLADALPSCTPTKPTIPRTSAVPCTSEASPRASHDVASTLASGSVATAGWRSARSLGCSAFAASGCATSGALTSSKVCSTWPAPWCACASLVPWTGDVHGSSASMLAGLTAATLDVRWCTTATTGGLD